MAISIVLRKEDGTEVDRAELPIFAAALPELARRVPMLRWINAYGNTIYNEIQRNELTRELNSATLEANEHQDVLAEVRRLCEVAKRPHQYLWFIGD